LRHWRRRKCRFPKQQARVPMKEIELAIERKERFLKGPEKHSHEE
jgi:hypothetical protein